MGTGGASVHGLIPPDVGGEGTGRENEEKSVIREKKKKTVKCVRRCYKKPKT